MAKRGLLEEDNSVSQTVKKIENNIIDRIIEDAAKTPYRISNAYKIPYKQHYFRLNYEETGKLTISYIIYFFKNQEEKNLILKVNNNAFDCEYDHENKLLDLVIVNVNGALEPETEANIMHEVGHCFEYSMGFKKDEWLYDKAVKLSKSKDPLKRNVGIALYFSFKHEQDSFADQYYKLCFEYEEGLRKEEYEPYMRYKTAIANIKTIPYGDRYFNYVLDEIGFTRPNFLKRLNFGLQRFKRKLNNARMAYLADKQKPIKENADVSLNSLDFKPLEIIKELNLSLKTDIINESRLNFGDYCSKPIDYSLIIKETINDLKCFDSEYKLGEEINIAVDVPLLNSIGNIYKNHPEACRREIKEEVWSTCANKVFEYIINNKQYIEGIKRFKRFKEENKDSLIREFVWYRMRDYKGDSVMEDALSKIVKIKSKTT